MTALAGIWTFGRHLDLQADVARMLQAQQGYGPHDCSMVDPGPIAMGRALYATLPEDDFDRQPMTSADGDLIMVADARLDDRDELLAQLGLQRNAALSDAGLLFRAFERWRVEALDRLAGDFAFAAWDKRAQELILARDTAGLRPLHYHCGDGFVAFATMPRGLHALPYIPLQLDEERLSSFVAAVPPTSDTTYFRGVKRLGVGESAVFTPRSTSRHSYWRLPRSEIRYSRPDDYLEAYREQLDRATATRLRTRSGRVGVHLSGGIDSGAVAATAARLLARRGGEVTAFTAAPCEGYAGAAPAGRITDESGLAAKVAELHPNLEHVVIRAGGGSILPLLADAYAAYQEPVGHPCNNVWWSAIASAARERGITVFLTGEVGNLTISGGTLGALSDQIASGRMLGWVNNVRALRRGGFAWRSLLSASFRRWVPDMLWARVNRQAVGETLAYGARLVRAEVQSRIGATGDGAGIAPLHRATRFQGLQARDTGVFRKGALARWGIDERDPTADRRLVEFCLSIPPEELLRDGMIRSVARRALTDRLPHAVLFGPRGYQAADWHEWVDRPGLEAALEEIRGGPGASVIDLQALECLVANWPPGHWEAMETVGTYRVAMLRAISAGLFAARFGK